VKLSVVIPARNEQASIAAVIEATAAELDRAGIEREIIVVDDSSSDSTAGVVEGIVATDPGVRLLGSPYPGGFGLAVRAGLECFEGDAVAVMMADGSDDPADLVAYWRVLDEGYDCAFGSRFGNGGQTFAYPRVKLAVNRIVNTGIRLLFGHGYNDTTNAFKAYRREVIETVQPLLSHHFNLTVELPLKAVIRGHSYAVVPISWRNRAAGRSKFAFQEMGSRYLFIILYAFLEHHLSRGDYRQGQTTRAGWRAGTPWTRAERPAASTRSFDPLVSEEQGGRPEGAAEVRRRRR
jgi:dolichol-phosphate mannosyltransferase